MAAGRGNSLEFTHRKGRTMTRRHTVQQHPIPASRPGIRARAAAASLVFFAGLTAAGADTPARKTIVAGNYSGGGFQRFFLVEEYRKAWGTPVSVERLGLGRDASGLTPTSPDGGQPIKVTSLTRVAGRS